MYRKSYSQSKTVRFFLAHPVYITRQVCSWVEFVDGCDAIHQAEMRADLSSQARTLDINVHHLRGNAITADPLSDSNEILCR